MRRPARSILVAFAVALVIPTPVLAAAAERRTDSSTQVWCGDLQSEAGGAYVNAWLAEGETFADLGFWAAPAQPGEDPVTWTGWSNNGLISADADSLEMTFGVYEAPTDDSDEPPDFVFVGEATLSARLSPAGDPETFRSNDRLGNRHTRASGSWQRFDVSGTLTLPDDISFDLGSCEVFRSVEHYFNNNPTHSVSHAREMSLACGWETRDGSASLFAVSRDGGTGTNLWISAGGSFLAGLGDAAFGRSSFAGTYDLYPGWDAEEPVGTASATAALAIMDRIRDAQQFGDSRYTFKGQRLGVSGTLTIDTPDGTTSLVMDDAACQVTDVRISQLPARTLPTPPAANDTPDAAEPIKIGDKLAASTSGTATGPEASCLLDDGEGGTFEAPLTNTLWWRIEGTGGSVTIDTAGSSFDTIAAVYVAEGDKVGAQIGCVDDVDDSAQARISFDAAVNAAYFLQIGGFDGSTGDVSLLITEP